MPSASQPWRPTLGLILVALIAPSGLALAQAPWSATLERGGRVEVDPRTHQPVLIQDGRQSQLWDGVHRLDDGTVIRIQDGRVVPTAEMLSPPRAESESEPEPESAEATAPAMPPDADGEPITGASPCERLVLEVCGAARTCWRAPPCEAARQLREMEREEWVRGADPGWITESGRQCRKAMGSDFFAPCQ